MECCLMDWMESEALIDKVTRKIQQGPACPGKRVLGESYIFTKVKMYS